MLSLEALDFGPPSRTSLAMHEVHDSTGKPVLVICEYDSQERLGAKIMQVSPGYLSNVQARARNSGPSLDRQVLTLRRCLIEDSDFCGFDRITSVAEIANGADTVCRPV